MPGVAVAVLGVERGSRRPWQSPTTDTITAAFLDFRTAPLA